MANVIFKVGTKEQYNLLEQKDSNTLYWLSDTQEIYKGDVLYGVGKAATQELAGLLSAEDKIKLDNLVAGSVAGLTPVDASILIGDGEDGWKTIGVQVSQEEGNTIALKADGLFASGTTVDTSKFVIGTVTDAGTGVSKIFNEASGGGSMYTMEDGTQSFVGVNNGELDGLMAQIYADKQIDGQWVGSRINVYHDHIYYTSLANKQAGKANNASDCEIATVGDVASVQAAVETLQDSLVWGSL